MKRAPFWCDGLDVDLLAAVPGAEEALGADADVRLFAHCDRPTHGRLNGAAAWDEPAGLVSHFGTSPAFVRAPGWVGGARIVECTFEELWRDVWYHDTGVRLAYGLRAGEEVDLLRPDHAWPKFQVVMGHVRGWGAPDPGGLWRARSSTLRAILASRRRLDAALRACGRRR